MGSRHITARHHEFKCDAVGEVAWGAGVGGGKPKYSKLHVELNLNQAKGPTKTLDCNGRCGNKGLPNKAGTTIISKCSACGEQTAKADVATKVRPTC